MGFDASGSSGSQQSESTAGFLKPEKERVSPFAADQIMSLSNMLRGRLFSSHTFPSFNLTSRGLFPEQENLFNQAVSQAASRFSGSRAARGFLQPENVAAIAGDAARAVSPQFVPLVGQQVQAAELLPETTFLSRLGALRNVLDLAVRGLGSSSSFTGDQSSFGFGVDTGARFAPGL